MTTPNDDGTEDERTVSNERLLAATEEFIRRLRKDIQEGRASLEPIERIVAQVLAEQGITRPEDLQEDGEQD